MLLLAAAAGSPAASPDDVRLREDQMKAAYLFNFIKFVEWPAATTAALRICFVGAQGVHDSLAESAPQKKVGSRSIVASTVPLEGSWSNCDVIYLDEAAHAGALQNTANSAILTVSDSSDFTRSGGIIRLFTQDNRLRFDVHVGNARRAGLKISSHILKLASRVEQDEGR